MAFRTSDGNIFVGVADGGGLYRRDGAGVWTKISSFAPGESAVTSGTSKPWIDSSDTIHEIDGSNLANGQAYYIRWTYDASTATFTRHAGVKFVLANLTTTNSTIVYAATAMVGPGAADNHFVWAVGRAYTDTSSRIDLTLLEIDRGTGGLTVRRRLNLYTEYNNGRIHSPFVDHLEFARNGLVPQSLPHLYLIGGNNDAYGARLVATGSRTWASTLSNGYVYNNDDGAYYDWATYLGAPLDRLIHVAGWYDTLLGVEEASLRLRQFDPSLTLLAAEQSRPAGYNRLDGLTVSGLNDGNLYLFANVDSGVGSNDLVAATWSPSTGFSTWTVVDADIDAGNFGVGPPEAKFDGGGGQDIVYHYSDDVYWHSVDTNMASFPPILLSPGDGTSQWLADGYTFEWEFNDPDPGDSQVSYRFRRRVQGTSSWEYWNATLGAWTAVETGNDSTTEAVTFPAGAWPQDNTVFEWTVSTREGISGYGEYATPFTVTANDTNANKAPHAPTLVSPANGSFFFDTADITFDWAFSDPNFGDTQSEWALRRRVSGTSSWEYFNATLRTWTALELFNTGTATAETITAAEGSWQAGEFYDWTVATKDQDGVVGPYADHFAMYFKQVVTADALTLDGVGSMSAAALVKVLAAATLEATGTLSSEAVLTIFMAAVIYAGAGLVDADGRVEISGDAFARGVGELAGAGLLQRFAGTVDLPASGGLSAVGVAKLLSGPVELSATGSMASVDASVHVFSGSADMVGSGSQSAAAMVNVLPEFPTFWGVGDVEAIVNFLVARGKGSLSAAGLVNVLPGAVDYDGAGTLVASGQVLQLAGASLPAAGTVAVSSQVNQLASADLSTAGGISVTGTVHKHGEAELVASGGISVDGDQLILATVELTGKGTLTYSPFPPNFDVEPGLPQTVWVNGHCHCSPSWVFGQPVSGWDTGDVRVEV